MRLPQDRKAIRGLDLPQRPKDVLHGRAYAFRVDSAVSQGDPRTDLARNASVLPRLERERMGLFLILLVKVRHSLR